MAGEDSIRDTRAMFAFFSSRLGCLGSVVVSLVGTAVLIVLLFLTNVL